MSEYRSVLERAGSTFPPIDLEHETILGRRDQKRRNQRVAAGALGIAVFALAAIGFARLLGSERESVRPATTPSPVAQPPFTERFDSPVHGLSIGYPSGWRTWAATEPWGHGNVTFGAPDVDIISAPLYRDDLYLALVSEPIASMSRPTEWVDTHSTNLLSLGICGGGVVGARDTLEGIIDGWFGHCDEPHGASGNVAIVATATRGYIIYLHVVNDPRVTARPENLWAPYDEDWFEAALETVDLRPEDAGTGPSETGPTLTGPLTGYTGDPFSVGFEGLPPEGVAPSEPAHGERVISLGRYPWDEAAFVHVYADGRLIWSKVIPDELPQSVSTFIEQRLTPEGVELLRSGAVPLVKGGKNPGQQLPATAWEDAELRPYVPTRYAISPWSTEGEDPSRALGTLPPAARELLRGTEERVFDDRGEELECFVVTIEDARALVEILTDAGFTGPYYAGGAAGMLWDRPDMTLQFDAVLPDGTISYTLGG